MKRLYTLFIYISIAVTTSLAANGKFILVIDAGHGGHDAGAVGKITKEKYINLNVALEFGRLVEQNCPDVRVIYTRKTDVFIPLQERANIANRANADLFISVHTNAVPAGRIARGFEVYTLGMHRAKDNLDVAMRENSVISLEKDYKQRYQGFDPRSSESYIMFEFMQTANMEKSVELARIIQRSVVNGVGRIDKGVHQAGFLVLRQTSMPSCLIELGFISTPDEEQYLDSESGVRALAQAIFNGFVSYKNKYNDKIVVPYAANNKNNGVESVGHIVPQQAPMQSVEQKKTKKKDKESPAPKPSPKNEGNQKGEVNTETKVTDDQSARQLSDQGGIIFKVQIFALNRTLRPGSEQFKGHKNVEYYQEGGVMKYTIGASTDYNEIAKLRKNLMGDFPQSFVVAFKNGKKIDINTAIAESKKK